MRIAPSSLLATLLLAACGSDPVLETTTDANPTPDAFVPPVAGTFEKCIVDGGTPKSAFTADNIHGPITTITTAGATSVVILGSADTSVKQWTISGTNSSYQTPFNKNLGSVVAELAHTDAMDVLGVTADGKLHLWTLLDSGSDTAIDIGAGALTGLATTGNGMAAVVATATTVRVVTTLDGTPAIGQPLATELAAVTRVAIANTGTIIDAGAKDGHPMIEARSLATPDTVTTKWTDATVTGPVRVIELSKDGTLLVVAGDGFVATFATTDLTTPTHLAMIADHAPVGIALLAGKTAFVTVGSEGKLIPWDVATVTAKPAFTIPTPIGVAADRDGTKVYTAGPDGNLHGWTCNP